VRVNDRGPFAEGRVIDLSYAAAAKLGLLGGVAPVTVRRITFGDMRAAQLLGFAELPSERTAAPHP
jgi:rare lipoprotein A